MRAFARTLGLLAVFGASLLASRALVAVAAPWEPETTAAAKLSLLEQAEDPVEIVFVGSSRTFRQVDPVAVDTGLQARGLDFHSLNLGVPGMAGIELLAFTERVLDEAGPDLRWLVVDIRYVEPILGSANIATTRVTWWHDPANTVLALESTARADRPIERRLTWALNHVVAFANQVAGTGVLLDHIAGPGIDNELDIGRDGTGFVPLDAALAAARARYGPEALDLADSLEQRRTELISGGTQAFERRVTRITRLLADPPPPTDLQLDYLERLVDLADEHAAGLVLLVPPGVSPTVSEQAGAWLPSAGTREGVDAVLDFNDPAAYPELFDYELWFDENHLGSEGARLFSGLLGEALAEVVAGS
jgi:hypothetical protein